MISGWAFYTSVKIYCVWLVGPAEGIVITMFAGVVPATKVDAWQGSLMITVNETGVDCASTTAVSVLT